MEHTNENMKLKYNADEIRSRTNKLAQEILASGLDRNAVCVCVLNGAVHFFSDLVRHFGADRQIAFVQPSSYGDKTVSSGIVTLKIDCNIEVKGREVLVVEDIVDTGRTVKFLKELFCQRGAKKVRVASLVDKPASRIVPLVVDFAAFMYEGNAFLVGCGMNFAQKFRCYPDIYELFCTEQA